MKPLSLVFRLGLTLCAFAVTILVIQVMSDARLREDREEAAYRDAATSLSITSSELIRAVGGVRNLLIGVAADAGDAVLDPAGCERRLEAVTKGRFMGRLYIGVFDSRTRIQCATDAASKFLPADIFTAGQSNIRREPVTGDVIPAIGTRGPVIPLAVPWAGKDGVSGSVLALVDLRWIEDVFEHRPLPPGTTAALVGKDGVVLISSPRMASGGAPFILKPGDDGHAVIWPDGVERFTKLSVDDAGLPGIMTAVGVGKAAALAPFRRAETRMLWSAVTVMAVCLALALVGLIFSVTRPLRNLIKAADLIGTGSESVKVKLEGAPEIRSLAVSMNRMSANLDEARAAQASARLLAEEADRSKSRFLAATSHDLRQPLQALTLFAAVLSDQVTETEAVRTCGQLQLSLETLRSLLDNLLDVSHLASGTVTARIEAFPVGPLLDELESAYSPIAAERGLKLVVLGSPAVILSDRMLLGRMVRNLLENAIRYTESGRILIDCYVTDGRHLTLEVRDTGIGIPAEEQAAIWEEYKQLENPARSREKGTGLGLSIVRKLSAILNHHVQMQSAVGSGSSFMISIPLATEEAPPPLLPPVRADETVPPGTRVLIIEDDVSAAAGISSVVTIWKATYEVSPRGGDAAGIARSFRPDVVVSDYNLPDITGAAAISSVWEAMGRRIPAILLTGEIGPAPGEDATRLGVQLLRKPVTAGSLAGTIRRTMESGSVEPG